MAKNLDAWIAKVRSVYFSNRYNKRFHNELAPPLVYTRSFWVMMAPSTSLDRGILTEIYHKTPSGYYILCNPPNPDSPKGNAQCKDSPLYFPFDAEFWAMDTMLHCYSKPHPDRHKLQAERSGQPFYFVYGAVNFNGIFSIIGFDFAI